MALVGGGKSPKFSNTKLILWDDNLMKVICEMRFDLSVKNVKLKKEKY